MNSASGSFEGGATFDCVRVRAGVRDVEATVADRALDMVAEGAAVAFVIVAAGLPATDRDRTTVGTGPATGRFAVSKEEAGLSEGPVAGAGAFDDERVLDTGARIPVLVMGRLMAVAGGR